MLRCQRYVRSHSREGGNPVKDVHPELVEGFIKLNEWFDKLTMNGVYCQSNNYGTFARKANLLSSSLAVMGATEQLVMERS
jgi:hypothetical protein